MIMNAKKNPNFPQMVKYLDLELPEQEIYCPPLTIRVLDCRYHTAFHGPFDTQTSTATYP